MKFIEPEIWIPTDDIIMEPNAIEAIKETGRNILVSAGPGAGKTELLAQKAAYLLQTGLCPYPKRILSISFKKDASKNIKERVSLRCGPGLSSRFDSFTFDAFSKSILDRFRNGLPDKFKPSSDYEIIIIKEREMQDILNGLEGRNGLTKEYIVQIDARNFEMQYLCDKRIFNDVSDDDTGLDCAKLIWHDLLASNAKSQLTFLMIKRLAELIINKNPKILKALKLTYPFVFIDEFQDTTDIQYELTKTCFLDSKSKLTAVGDDKQKIMAWAGANPKIFDIYKSNFNAKEINLFLNHRSAPRLVEIQHYIACTIKNDENLPACKPVEKKEKSPGECNIWEFEDHESEAACVAEKISGYINDGSIKPKDICIIARMKLDKYTDNLSKKLKKYGIKSRIENDMQDLISEPVTLLIIGLLRIVVDRNSQSYWSTIKEYLFSITSGDEEKASRIIEKKFREELPEIRKTIETQPVNGYIENILKKAITFLNENHLKNSFRQYHQGNYFNDIISKVTSKLENYFQENGSDWTKTLDDFEGLDSIPIMSIHKSKGLEYDTVIFIGLEDYAFFGYNSDPLSETCGFFVAFSRAINRVIFTYCGNRGRVDNYGNLKQESKEGINELYEILKNAGIEAETIDYQSSCDEHNEPIN